MRTNDSEPPSGADSLAMAYEMWGNPVRERLYRYVRDNPGLFFGEIYDGFRPYAQEITGQNFPTASFARHLQKMRELGVLETDLPAERSRGRSPRYYPVPQAADRLIDSLMERISALRSSVDQAEHE